MTWALVDEKTGAAITLPAIRKDFRGDMDTVIGGKPPHKPGSTGFVHTKGGMEYYAGVFGLKWEQK